MGSDVKVECSSLANPEPSSYKWTRADSVTWGEEGRWLVLRNVSHADSGEYTCTATNRQVVTNSQNRPNTKYIRFLRNDRILNTKYIWFLKMIKY